MMEQMGRLIRSPSYTSSLGELLIFFLLGNCLNFVSFAYAAQFVSNIAFAYFMLNKMVTVKVLVATTFIVVGNVFLVAFGNHQSPGWTEDKL